MDKKFQYVEQVDDQPVRSSNQLSSNHMNSFLRTFSKQISGEEPSMTKTWATNSLLPLKVSNVFNFEICILYQLKSKFKYYFKTTPLKVHQR